MKQMDPRIVNGKDSPNDAFQKTDRPISRNTVPLMKRKIDRNKLLSGRDGRCNASGAVGSNLGTLTIPEDVMIVSTSRMMNNNKLETTIFFS